MGWYLYSDLTPCLRAALLNKNKTGRSSRKQPCVFIFNLSFLLEMMKPWQAPFKKAPSKDKGGKGSTNREDPSQSQKGLRKATLCFVWKNI
jgi:hypothetical protein